MIISEILEVSKSKKKIYIDREFAFVLYKGELRKYGIKQGEELSSGTYRQIMTEVLPKRAKLRCMNLLKSKDYTTEQLRLKLRQGLYPESVIEEALSYVASFGYTDDLRYAEDFIHYNQETKSRRRIENDLQRKGIAKDVIATAWLKWEQQGNEQDEEGQILKLLAKKHFDEKCSDAKEMQKVYGFLFRKGFKPDSIRNVLGNYNEEMYNLGD